MIQRPCTMGSFEFVVVAALRAKQLARGCLPRVEGCHSKSVTALLEVAGGKVAVEAVVPIESPKLERFL